MFQIIFVNKNVSFLLIECYNVLKRSIIEVIDLIEENIFAMRLKELREEANLTQNELAEKLGIGRATLSNYELGVRKPDIDTLQKIANYFNVSSDYLLGMTPIKKRDSLNSIEEIIKEKKVKELKNFFKHEENVKAYFEYIVSLFEPLLKAISIYEDEKIIVDSYQKVKANFFDLFMPILDMLKTLLKISYMKSFPFILDTYVFEDALSYLKDKKLKYFIFDIPTLINETHKIVKLFVEELSKKSKAISDNSYSLYNFFYENLTELQQKLLATTIWLYEYDVGLHSELDELKNLFLKNKNSKEGESNGSQNT
ncbi:transcriptional regulator with XRE-family HTH domain [Caldicellulosiruptor bescii]|nr:transcriptional regulator with XRE-family HTH domain [Caldicellulosiruptor bescii]PBC90476.1 transcriptional regulator with XRE-family HTH domain [Caldicellulosiruptor bescii]PBD04092.1 transcriptional regulator with XRE-family HTH domain [Caldicellulosiruptor bescii]PBD06273.1 transcriptional regulator with XRE-family HTH domain [Caldicellulosiruptor bescii]PBD08721.1 transcriptional regulator with XRE-family HTH domain [Caldicellulosiruptor bescii]